MAETLDMGEDDRWRSGGRFTTAIHAASGGAAGVLLFVLMAVTMIDVVGRYVFNAPLQGGTELIQMIMAALIYSALPSVCRQEGHIAVDLLDHLTPARLVPARQILVNLVGAVILGVIAWRLWTLAQQVSEDNVTWEYLTWSRAPIVYFMCALAAIGTLILLVNLVRYGRGARAPAPGFI